MSSAAPRRQRSLARLIVIATLAVRTVVGRVRRHVGSDDTLPDAMRDLATTWLDTSGETRRHVPVYLHRVHVMPDVPEHGAVTDIYLPLVTRQREHT